MPNDEYNTYRYDFVDGFERERRVEYLSSTLQENQKWLDSNGILSETVEVTQMEIANGLTVDLNQQLFHKFKFDGNKVGSKLIEISRLDIKEADDAEHKIMFDLLFPDYGELNMEDGPYRGTRKAIRVWSGADHWLLPRESALKNLYLLPITNGDIPKDNADGPLELDPEVVRVLIYWPDAYGSIVDAIEDGTIYTRRNAFLYLIKKSIKIKA